MKESDILISVIIPVYNVEDCLNRCVTSVCNQTHDKMEIILVDDGSTDNSGALCEQFAKDDERIRVFHKENGGSSSARNLGLSHAVGTYIGFIDSDDYIEPDMYECLLKTIIQNDILMAQISRNEIDENGRKLPDVCIPPQKETMISSKKMMEELLMHRGDCSFCTRLTHRSLFENKRFPEGKLNEDFYLLVQMLLEIDEFMILPEQYYHVFYRIGSNSRKKDKNDFPQVYTDIVDNADMVTELVQTHYPDLQEMALRFGFYQRLEYLLHIPINRMKRDNSFYRENVCGYLRKHWKEIPKNPYLTKKNKQYLLLLTMAPKTVRILHAGLRALH
ncbi:MAG: glycosyltransferase family 2 protein [Lachnospiraceae bacterium]